MALLSKRLMMEAGRAVRAAAGVNVLVLGPTGAVLHGEDRLRMLPQLRRRRSYALQESTNSGEPHPFLIAPGVQSWVVGLEDRRVIHGGLCGAPVRLAGEAPEAEVAQYLEDRGMPRREAEQAAAEMPEVGADAVRVTAARAQEAFYRVAGWQPVLMRENRTRVLQQAQISEAIEDRRRKGADALYAFEKERVLLANIRAGDRNEARRILNDMLATIYLSSPQLVVLRARTIELLSCLTRAAIEDNPMLERMIERNHEWTERLIRARSFEELSQVLMSALDGFVDSIYLHGMNRSNLSVRKALEFIAGQYAAPIGLSEVALHVGLSPCRLAHLVKEYTGRTVLQIIHETRVQHAQQSLDRTSKSCAEIGYEVGFGDQSYFIKHFRRLTGTTPARYRRARRQ